MLFLQRNLITCFEIEGFSLRMVQKYLIKYSK